MFDNPFLQLFNPLLNNQGFLGATTQARQNQFSPISTINANTINALKGVGPASGGGVAGSVQDDIKKIAGEESSALVPALGIGLTAISTLMSMSEAGKAADAQRAADRAAAQALVEQKRLQEQNFYEALRVPTEAYDRQFREGTAANAQAVEALSQDQRSLIGGIQGVQEATIEGQAKTREALADRLFNLDVMKAGAATQQADDLSKIAADEAQGAQIAAMAAEKAKIAQQQAALQGVGGVITQGAGMIGTYGGLANQGDQLQTLLGGTSFAKPSAQPTQAQLLQMISQNPNLLMQLLGQQKSTLG
jgi:hypothetical protein